MIDINTKTINEVYFKDLEKTIKEILNIDYELAIDHVYINDSTISIDVSKINKTNWEDDRLDRLIKKFDLYDFMDIMCSFGLIPEGEYLINFSW